MTNTSRLTAIVSLLAVLTAVTGCSNASSSPTCGDDGTSLQTGTAVYCAYAIVIGGFRPCPDAAPNRVATLPQDRQVCSSQPMTELPLEVCRALGLRCENVPVTTDAGDGGRSDGSSDGGDIGANGVCCPAPYTHISGGWAPRLEDCPTPVALSATADLRCLSHDADEHGCERHRFTDSSTCLQQAIASACPAIPPTVGSACGAANFTICRYFNPLQEFVCRDTVWRTFRTGSHAQSATYACGQGQCPIESGCLISCTEAVCLGGWDRCAEAGTFAAVSCTEVDGHAHYTPTEACR